MKKIFYTLILALFLFMAIDNALYNLLSFSFNKSSYFVEFVKSKHDLLFFGDSKFVGGIIPAVIQEETDLKSYNMAGIGAGIIFSKALESVALHHNPPKLIVLQMMDLSQERDSTFLSRYLSYPEVREVFSIYPLPMRLKYFIIKSSRYNSLVLRIFWSMNKPVVNKGYKPYYGRRKYSTIDQKIVSDKFYFSIKDGENMLLDFVEEAIKNKVKILFVVMPSLWKETNPSYYIYKKIADIYKIPFLDFSTEGPEDLNIPEDHFYDVTHLNDKGANIFSSILAKKIAAHIFN